MAGWVDCSSSFSTPQTTKTTTSKAASTSSLRSSTQPTSSLKQLRLFPLDKASLVTPRASSASKARQAPSTQPQLDRAFFNAQPNATLLNSSSKGKARAFASFDEAELGDKSRARLLTSSSTTGANARKENIAQRIINPRPSQRRKGPTLDFDASSSPPMRTQDEMIDEERRRRKRRFYEGGAGQLDLVSAPDFEGFGGEEEFGLESTPVKRRRGRATLEMGQANAMLGSVQPAEEFDRDLGGEEVRFGEEFEPLQVDAEESAQEPDTMDEDEDLEVLDAAGPSVSTNDADEERLVQAVLVGHRKGNSSSVTVLVPDSDEEEGLDAYMAQAAKDVLIVDSEGEEDEFAALARQTAGAADDSGFAELECDDESEGDETQPLAHNSIFATIEDTVTSEQLLAPVLAPEPTSTPSSGSLGRSESSILMPPPPLPARWAKESVISPPRVLVADTQSQLLTGNPLRSPSRVVVDETQRRPTPPRRSITAALQDAWAGQLPPAPRQLGIAEFFERVPKETSASEEQDEEMVIEDSQRVPSLAEQVATAAMLRDVRATRQRLAQEAQKTPEKRAAVIREDEEEDDDVEDADDDGPLVPSSQPRADECGVGLSPLKTPSKDRIFTPPRNWPVSPSKRAIATAGPSKRTPLRMLSSSAEDGEEPQSDGLEELETQWESYWTLASPSGSMLDQF